MKLALAWLYATAKERGFIAVMGYGNLEGVVSDILGRDAVKQLRKSGSVRIDGKELHLITKRKKIYSADDEPILGIYPDASFLDEIDSIYNVSAMLVVPWTFNEISLWIKTHNASELGAEKETEVDLIENKVVEVALKGLVASINISTGISHPSDRESTVWTFTILRDAGEYFNPDDVKGWLVRHGGMKATDAEKVREIAQKVLERRRLRKGRRPWRRNVIKYWRERALEE